MSVGSFISTKTTILAFAEEYCKNNGLSVSKLKKQNFGLSKEAAVFSTHTSSNSKGLIDELKTPPVVTLIVRIGNDKFIAEETKETRRYLSEGI